MSAETRATLDAALQAHARDEWDDTSIVIDWVVVGGSIDHEGHPGIYVDYSRVPMPGYISRGLLEDGLDLTMPD